MLIATSLMYSDDEWEIEKQKKAIQTWRDIGFDVISCNVKEEIEKLQKVFTQVRFVQLSRSGQELVGKPYPYIYDILQALLCNIHEEKEICGIVNSDIFIKNLPSEYIKDYLDINSSTVLIMHRYDIEDEEDTQGEYYFSGIDVFFFYSDYIFVFPDMGFMMGRPEWDHWFLYEAVKAGMQVKELKNKIAFHIKHKQRWTAADSNRMVVNKMKKPDSICLDEDYYYKTNILMSDLACRIPIKKELLSADSVVIKEDSLYCDADRKLLLEWEKEAYRQKDIQESIGILYYKNQRPYRVCALHRELMLNPNGKFSLGKMFLDERAKGNILKYVDFKDLEFAGDLGRVYLYPAGRASRLLLDCMNTYNIPVLGMIDRDASLWGKTYMGKKIMDLSVLDNSDSYDYILIATNLYVREIYEELSKRVEKNKLVVL